MVMAEHDSSKHKTYKTYYEPQTDNFVLPYSTKVRKLNHEGESVNDYSYSSQCSEAGRVTEVSDEEENDTEIVTATLDSDADSCSEKSSCSSVGEENMHMGHAAKANFTRIVSSSSEADGCTEESSHVGVHHQHYAKEENNSCGNSDSEADSSSLKSRCFGEENVHTGYFEEVSEEQNLAGQESSSESDIFSESDDNLNSSDSDQDDASGLFGHDRSLNDYLSPGISTTKAEAMLMVMTFAMRHCLSAVGLFQLLQLINEVIGRPVLPETKHLFEKVFHSRSANLTFQFYCTLCLSYVCEFGVYETENVACPNCGAQCYVASLVKENFFITSDLTSQMKVLLEKPTVHCHLGYRLDRHKISQSNMEDIYDGEIYKELCKEGKPLFNNDNFSYTFNSDGVPIFTSSKFSLWPIFLMVNELPPKMRRENLILAGIWCGKTKPNMMIFLQKFVEEAQVLATDGVRWVRNGVEVVSRFFGLCCCVDAPARASMQNTVQFNGYYGCSLCYHPGKLCSGVVKYPIDVVEYTDREEHEMLSDMLSALEENRSVRGVKGPTPLIALPNFPIVWGFPPDFMHCCLLGVTRQLSELWFGTFGEDYYIGNPRNLALIDRRLSSIQPPNVISRPPRPMSERKYWKASEWYNWLLFFSLPCLYGILPNEYLQHFGIFVQAMSILLQKSISSQDGDRADLLMMSFVGRTQVLYGASAMTFNVHSLTHLAKRVKYWGPLWTHSCFPFESCNGQIKKLLSGNKGIALQAMHKFMLLKAIPLFMDMYNVSDKVSSFCNQLLGGGVSHRVAGAEIDSVQLLGRPKSLQLSEEERFGLTSNGFDTGMNIDSFDGIKKAGFTYQTKHYTRATVRSNRYFSLLDGTPGDLHRIIMYDGQCLLLYKRIIVNTADEFRDPQSEVPLHHIKCWTGTHELLEVAPAELLSGSCVCVTIHRHSYLCFLPNHCVL